MALPDSSRFAVLAAFALIWMVSATYFEQKAAAQPVYKGAETTIFHVPKPIAGIFVEGSIFCRKGNNLFPLPGAMSRITCATIEHEQEATPLISIVSSRTDSNGYFQINLSMYDEVILDLDSCKVFLQKPPPGVCSFRTNVNKGLTGASFPPTFRSLKNKSRIYSVPPLVYTNNPTADKP